MVLGLVAAPGAAGGLAVPLAEELRPLLADRLPGARWRLEVVEDALVRPPAADAEIVDAARRLLLTRGWDLTLCLTDLPLRAGRRPVVAHANPLHGVGLLSVPALGAVTVHRRARDAALRLLDALLGEAPGRQDATRSRRLTERVRELATETASTTADDTDDTAQTLAFTARVLTGNLRLLVGMVRANQPWRLAARLSRALVAAGAAGVFALVTSDIWKLADALGTLRLAGVAVGSLAAIVATLILGAGLWEHARTRRMREQVVLFNLATVATVLLGVLAFYTALFALSLTAALLLVVPRLLADALGHPVTITDYAELAWLTSSLATAGGALGAGLETDDAVRQAAYTRRTSDAIDSDTDN